MFCNIKKKFPFYNHLSRIISKKIFIQNLYSFYIIIKVLDRQIPGSTPYLQLWCGRRPWPVSAGSEGRGFRVSGRCVVRRGRDQPLRGS